MVYREKDSNPPAALADPRWDLIKQDALINKHNHEVVTKCYRDSTLDTLVSLYKNKCAICERDRGLELQVDHYRPKKPRNNRSYQKYNQPGYYWLTYEWENLIPLCSKCNQNKSNKFPIKGWPNRTHINVNNLKGFNAFSLKWLQNYERPLIINPEFDKTPERHFSFQRDGRIVGRTDEGKETIEVCKLNRKDLRRERLKIREKYVNSIKSALDDYSRTSDLSELKGELKGMFKRIKKSCHINEPHSLYHIFLYRYFDYFIDSKLPANLRGNVTKYFNEFKSSFP